MKIFLNEKSNDRKQVLFLLFLYASPVVGAMEANKEIEEMMLCFYEIRIQWERENRLKLSWYSGQLMLGVSEYSQQEEPLHSGC